MWYVLEDTVPASTARTAKRTTRIKVGGGILHTIYVLIPPGSANLAHFQLKQASYFLLPRNEDKSMSGEQLNIPYVEWYKMGAAENTLTMFTWNLDTANQHTIRLLIGVLPTSVMEMEEEYLKTLQQFMRLFKRRT